MNNKEQYDVIVIGTGPGGATVAKELSQQGKKVLILERGPNPEIRGRLSQFLRYAMIPGKSLLFTGNFLAMVRGIVTGGSSIFFYGTAGHVPLKMFKSYGIDLTDEVHETLNELSIAPMKEEMLTPMVRKIQSSARQLGYDWKPLDKFMDQDKWQSGQDFGYYGDSSGVKWNAGMFVNQARQSGAVLITKAKVTKVIIENNSAVGVEYKQGLHTVVVRAPQIVLAAGGIGSAVIMKKSGFTQAGQNIFIDPLISVCGTVDDIKAKNEIPMSAGIHLEKEGCSMTDLSLPPFLHMFFAAQVFRFSQMFNQKKTLRIMVKVKDDLGGYVTDGGGVCKKLSESDLQKLDHGYQAAKKILENAGAKNIYKTWYTAAHPGATVKIGELVDSNLKAPCDNLYVCDCSVIPQAWGLPPVLTIISLGKRLAKHLT